MIYSVVYHSPIFQNQRVFQLESRYEKVRTDVNAESFRINDREVSKEQYLNNLKARIKKEKNKKFNFPYMAIALIWNGLILLFLSRGKIKQQFEKESIAGELEA